MPLRETYRFGEFELNLNTYELRRGEQPIHMERRPMDLLVLMLQRPGELITRDEIVAHTWGADVFIESESGVNTLIRKIRQALGDASDAPGFVETVPGRGYRFIAQPVTASALAPAGIVVMSRPPHVSLAVLPFENIGLEPDYEHLPDALHVETIAALGQVDPEHIVLVSRSGTMKYTGSRQTSGEIARELHVAYLVESSLRSENGVVRITSGLVRASDQVQVWSASYRLRATTDAGVPAGPQCRDRRADQCAAVAGAPGGAGATAQCGRAGHEPVPSGSDSVEQAHDGECHGAPSGPTFKRPNEIRSTPSPGQGSRSPMPPHRSMPMCRRRP